jgi:hypothetical protein
MRQYDVALGRPIAVVSTNQTATTYQPVALTGGTVYYWRIVAKGAGGSTSGPIWTLTTAAAARPAPVAAYAFTEGAGTTTADASGSGRTGTLTSATWSAAGKIGGWFAQFLASQGFAVEIADPAGGAAALKDWRSSALEHDYIVVAAPLGATNPSCASWPSADPAG